MAPKHLFPGHPGAVGGLVLLGGCRDVVGGQGLWWEVQEELDNRPVSDLGGL